MLQSAKPSLTGPEKKFLPRRAAPTAAVTMLRASDPSLYASGDGWFDITPEQIHTLVSFVAKAAPPADARLLLIAPYLAQPQMRTATDYRGTGSVAGLGFYLFTVHTATTGERSFLNRDLLKSANFVAGTLLMFCVGLIMTGTLALLSTMLQNLMAYPR